MEECLELQLSEVELLSSMYPGQGEMVLDNPAAVDIVRSHLDGEKRDEDDDLESLPSLSFALNLSCTAESKEFQVKMHCRLARSYPTEAVADAHVSSDTFSRQSQRELNEELKAFAGGMLGESMLLSLVQWVQENAERFVQESSVDAGDDVTLGATAAASPGPCKFSRIWLYMHHIYSKHKRKDILDWSHELGLSGFCLPGKPGVVCAEGDASNVDDFFHRLRNMTWKKMTCRYREELTGNVEELRAFKGFGEMNFDAHGGRHNHMDMGLFFQYLEKHKLGEMFQVLFGIEGRLAEEED